MHASTAVFKSSNYIKLSQLCNENHFAINCTKYKTVDSKRARVSELKLCFNCLRGKHTANNCRTEGKCKRCSGKHHTSICRSNFNGYSASRVQSKSQGISNAFGNNSNVHGSYKCFGNSNLNSSNSYDGSCSDGNSNPNGGLQSYGNSNGNYGQSSVCGISGFIKALAVLLTLVVILFLMVVFVLVVLWYQTALIIILTFVILTVLTIQTVLEALIFQTVNFNQTVCITLTGDHTFVPIHT